MRKVYTAIILLVTMLASAMTIAQELQKGYINYQGVARQADGTLMSGMSLTIDVKLKFGSSSAEAEYEESHSLTTDANGVFSLSIGDGSTISGDYGSLPWGNQAAFASISLNGNEIGTTELMAVPHALSSADNQWHTKGDDIENKNGGNVFVTGSLYASKDLSLAEGAAISEFSTDGTLAANSDEIVPTQRAIKTYVDSHAGGGSGGGTDDQTAAEVTYDNSTSGLTATTAQAAIDELVGSGSVDADPDPTNELQDISLSGTNLSISDGSTIDLAPIVPPGGTDDQNLILTGDILSIENGSGSVDLSTYAGDDADADPTNEIDVTSETGLLMGDGSIITGLVGTADGQVAKWDAGTNSWKAGTDATGGGGGSSLWTENAGDIYYNGGKVGVGTNTPEASIAIETDGNQWDLTSTEGDFRIGDASHRLKIGVATAGAGAGDARIRVAGGTDRMMLGGGSNDVLTITDTNVGVGTITPAAKLHVNGNIRSNDLSGGGNVIADAVGNLIIGPGSGGSSLWSDNGGNIYYNSGKVGVGTNTPESSIAIETDGNQWNLSSTEGDFRIGDAAHRLKIGVATAGAGAGDARIRVEGGTDRMMLGGGTNDVLTITDQNVGIGTITPVEKLHVDGSIRSNDLSGAGERNVVADANGNLIIGAGGGGGSLWTANGSDIHYNSGKVGVGTNAPEEKLHVEGDLFVNSSVGSINLGFPGTGDRWSFSTIDGGQTLQYGSTPSGGAYSTRFRMHQDGEFTVGNIASPKAWLHAKKNSTVSKPQLMLEEIGDDFARLELRNDQSSAFWHVAGIGRDGTTGAANSELNFYFRNNQGAANRMTVKGSGKVGIGTQSPQARLHVKGDIRSDDLAGTGERNVVADADGNLIIGAGGSGSSAWTESGANVYRTGGSVGIGAIPNPNYKLHLNGSMLYEGRFLKFDGGTDKQWTQYIDPVNGSIGFGHHTTNSSAFMSRFKLATTGELELGTQSRRQAWLHVPKNSTVVKPHLKLEETENDYARIELSSATNNAFWHIAGIGADGVTGAANSRLNFYFQNNQGAANRMTITGAGDVLVDGSLVHSSDRRLKRNIEALPYGLKEILMLEPKIYSWIDDRSEGTRSLGLIAQDVEQIIPEIVHKKADSEKTLSLSYTELIPIIISAVKEQQNTIEQQSERITDLEKRLKKLEAKIGN